MRLSILIVSYNTREMTLDCIRSIYGQAQSRDFEVIVVDNASSDGSADAIEREFPEVRLLRLRLNLGFARANNAAAREAAGDYLLLLNPDTAILDHAIDRLVAFAHAHPDAGIWGGRTVFADGSLNPTSCWRFMSPWSILAQALGLTALRHDTDLFNREGYGGWRRDSEREVDFVTGCFLLIRRSLWDDLNGFDETFFMYAEEADLCYRARQSGARPLFTPDAVIIHYGGASDALLSEKMPKLFSGKISFLNKHWPSGKRVLGINLFKLLVLTRVVGFSAAALLTRKERYRESQRAWRSIWSVRHEWTNGYRPASPGRSGPAAIPRLQ